MTGLLGRLLGLRIPDEPGEVGIAVLGGLAASTVWEASGASAPLDACQVGIAVGLACLLAGMVVPRRWPLDVVAGIATVVLLVRLPASVACLGTPELVVGMWVLLAGAVVAFGFVLGRMVRRAWSAPVGLSPAGTVLAAFGLLDLVRFLAAPLDVLVLPNEPGRAFVTVGVALALGVLAGARPGLALPVIGFLVGFAELAASAVSPSGVCSPTGSRLACVVGFLLVYVLFRPGSGPGSGPDRHLVRARTATYGGFLALARHEAACAAPWRDRPATRRPRSCAPLPTGPLP